MSLLSLLRKIIRLTITFSYLLTFSFNLAFSHNTIVETRMKIITSAEREWRNQETLVQNDSMYSVDEVA